MYGKRFRAIMVADLTVLQKEEIRRGIEDGMGDEELRLFAKPYFNHLQMKEIRQAVREGIDPVLIRRHWKPSRNFREMKELRIALVSGEALPDKNYLPVMASVLLAVSLLLCLGLYFVRYPAEKLSLELNCEEAELTVGEMFDPMAYILSYSGKEALLVLPKDISTEKPGTSLAVYQLKGRNRSLTKTIRIIVKDEPGKKEKIPQTTAVSDQRLCLFCQKIFPQRNREPALRYIS